MDQPKELSLGIRLILFALGLSLVFFTAWGLKTFIDGFQFENKYSSYLIYLGAFCILLWAFLRSLIIIPIGSVGVPLMLKGPYKTFLFPAGYTWLPIFSYIPIDKKHQIVDLDFEISPTDLLQLNVKTTVDYNIIEPFLYIEKFQKGVGFKKIKTEVEEVINQYSEEKGLTGDYLLKNSIQLKEILKAKLAHYANSYGINIFEVHIKSVKPDEEIIGLNKDIYAKKKTEILNFELSTIANLLNIELNRIKALVDIEIQTLAIEKKHELFINLAKASGVSYQQLLNYDLINNGKISISEIIKTFNINLNSDLIKELFKIFTK